MATKYPQYKIGQWIDTSEEAMSKPELTISYGVEIRPYKGAKWMHCCRDNKPLIFGTADEASAEIAKLKSNAELSGPRPLAAEGSRSNDVLAGTPGGKD